ncbi:carotenoid biosynthesis protein [Nocardia macrotermitis]|uniref:Carotenoid biosynthesis protein n=1 Tax=Nocardia macrotermitis TaxID=2585198 RepID=A0A7K0D7Y9_9NOCA|nr:carotenoid biosynthesis protein [Nocardia macrotermitis]MQY21661.1 hypothetical protein [Nocardia macrotermitis]
MTRVADTRDLRIWQQAPAWVVAVAGLCVALGGALGIGTESAFGALPGVTLLFAVIHGLLTAGWRSFLGFCLVGYVVAFVAEVTSVAYGVPFGFYQHFTAGPRLFDVPLIVPIAYVGNGWLAITLASAIVRGISSRKGGNGRFAIPVVATIVLAGWDLTVDSIYSTVEVRYRYTTPGAFFGVPISNFFGWLLVGWIIFQIFVLLRRDTDTRTATAGRPLDLLACLVWVLPVLPLFGYFSDPPPGRVSVGGRVFVIADIYASAFIIGLITLGFTAVLAAIRICDRSDPALAATAKS